MKSLLARAHTFMLLCILLSLSFNLGTRKIANILYHLLAITPLSLSFVLLCLLLFRIFQAKIITCYVSLDTLLLVA